jgi:hypothetical protein
MEGSRDHFRWIALGVTVLIALGGGAQWYASNLPSIDFYTEDDTDKPQVGLAITNHGPGLATIKLVAYFVDGRLMKDGDAALDYAKQDSAEEKGVDLYGGDTLAVGETVWLFAHLTKKIKNKKELERYVSFLDDHLGVKVTYCLRLGFPCWQSICSLPDRC